MQSLRSPANILYSILLLASTIGVLLPLVAVHNNYLQPASSDFSTFIPHFFKTLPTQYYKVDRPFLYFRYAVFNLILVGLLLVCRHRVRAVLGYLINWCRTAEYKRERYIIMFFVFFVVVTFQAKINWGFWYPGICGWTEASQRKRLTAKFKPLNPSKSTDTSQYPFLEDALIKNNAEYLNAEGFLPGRAMFLHFNNGEVLPFNYEITDFVFPYYVFPRLKTDKSQQKLFFRLVKSNLKIRSKNRRFLLPKIISYPNHSPYMAIDYSSYPPADQLKKISSWRIIAQVKPGKSIKIADAKLMFSFPH